MALFHLPTNYQPARMSLDRGTPASEPVTASEVKAHCRIDYSDDDTLIAALIQAAREHVENVCRRALVQRAHVLKLDRFPVGAGQVIALPGGNVQSITSIQYVDGDGATQTWGASNYDTDLVNVPARIALAYGATWPSVRGQSLPVTITYQAGYAPNSASPPDAAANVPQALKNAMLLLIGHWYENREATIVGVPIAGVPMTVDALLAPYRVITEF